MTSQSAAEPALELLAEAPEELDVLGLLAGEPQQRAHPTVVGVQLRPGVIEHERQDELLDQPEQAQVAVTADLVERAFAPRGRGRQVCRADASGMNGREKSSVAPSGSTSSICQGRRVPA